MHVEGSWKSVGLDPQNPDLQAEAYMSLKPKHLKMHLNSP